MYVVKELLDNAVAALEEHGKKTPMIKVSIQDDYIEVVDNGPGISDSVLDKILDFDQFGGSNRHHKLPTRGAQGNAIMTLVGIASVWTDDPIVISRPCGPTIELIVELDPVRQEVSIDRNPVSVPSPSGIRVPVPELPWKRGGADMDDVESVVKEFAWMNPHVMFMIKRGDSGYAVPMSSGAAPAMVDNPKCGAASWFTDEEFIERFNADVRARPQCKLYDWMREFAFGRFSARSAQESGFDNQDIDTVADSSVRVPAVRRFLIKNHDDKRAADPRFKPVGQARLASFLSKVHGADHTSPSEYHTVKGTFGDDVTEVPYLVEVCLVQMPDGRRSAPVPVLAMNRTVLYGSPSFKAKDGFKYREKIRGKWRGLNGDLGSMCRAYQIDHGKYPAAVVVHVTCPSPGYSGYGKQQFDTSWLAEDLSTCFERVTLQVRRQRAGEARRRNSNRPKRDTIKKEMFRLIPGVLDEVSENGKYEPLIRQFYYSFRKEWYRHDDRTLHYGTFCAYVDKWERRVGKSVCLRDPRGTMYEPHGGRTVRLGTADVRGFKPKKWLGHTVIFVEKENLAAQMRAMKIDKRWDAIIVGSKGFAVEAIRDVLQKYRKLLGDMVKIVCLHDADPAGYMIGYDLQTNLPRFGDTVDVQVIDVGLTVKDAIEMGLQDEPFPLKKQVWSMVSKTMRLKFIKDPDGTRRPLLEPEAWDAFVPKMFRGQDYSSAVGWALGSSSKPKGRRIELNAMTPREFETWVETNLEKHGCGKVRPPDEVVNDTLKRARTNKISNSVGEMFMRIAGEDIVMEVFREVGVPSYDLDKVLEGRPEQHWEYLVTYAAQRGDDVNNAVERVMKRKLPRLFETGLAGGEP